jgi:hypothetical protein
MAGELGHEQLSLKTPFLEAEWAPQEKDREDAWELYVEMLTRIITQPLPDDVGNEKVALDRVYAIFPLTREILRRKGRECEQFTKISVVVLNHVVRPFTAKWYRLSLTGGFTDPKQRASFRTELPRMVKKLERAEKGEVRLSQSPAAVSLSQVSSG